MNNTVYFNPEWMEALDLLDEDTRNAVISGIVTYQITGTVPPAASGMAVFILLKIEVDRRNRRIARNRDQRRQRMARQLDSPAPDATPLSVDPVRHHDRPEPVDKSATRHHLTARFSPEASAFVPDLPDRPSGNTFLILKSSREPQSAIDPPPPVSAGNICQR